ncbi:MAG: ferrous iron transport protein B [Bacillota bacterium]
MSCHGAGHPLSTPPTTSRPFTVALVGNPNVGKSSLFNLLTGLHQRVGNWPGKTVERREGFLKVAGREVVVTDLPGIYSLSPHTLEEAVAREFLLEGKPDLVINAVDAANLERNLYLTTELLDLESPLVVALTMTDLAEAKGLRFNVQRLQAGLGVPVVEVAGSTGRGLDALLRLLEAAVNGQIPPAEPRVRFGHSVEALIQEIAAGIPYSAGLPRRWAAVKVIEQDPEVLARLASQNGHARDGAAYLTGALREMAAAGGAPSLDGPLQVADERYAWIGALVQDARESGQDAEAGMTFSDRLDAFVTGRLAGPPLAVLLLAAGIWGAFRLAGPLQDLMDSAFAALGQAAVEVLGGRLPAWAVALVRDGVINGVAAVALFAPLVAAFFLFLGLLEDSGYFARAAFVLDRLIGRFGLQGKAGIGLMIGYGCNVPAVMAARTAPSQRSRVVSILVSPLVICSARLVVISFLASVFFPGGAGAYVLGGLYALGVVLVLAVSWVLYRTALRGEEHPFMIELPPYRVPNLRNAGLYAWQQSVHFLRRAAAIIAPMTVVVWAMSYFPHGRIEDSILGTLGRALAPIGAPLGLDWRMIVSFFPGFVAKEATLPTLAVLYAGGAEEGLAAALRSAVSIPQALAYLVFYAFYTPCLATATTIYQETRSLRWTLFTMAYNVSLAALLAFAVFKLAMRAWSGAGVL